MDEGREGEQAGKKIQRLALWRIVLAATAFGMSIATAILLVVTLVQAFRGDPSVLASLRGLFVMAAMVGGAAVAVPRIDRRILQLARNAPGHSACVGLLRVVTGFPLLPNQRAVEEETARQLAEVNSDWWEAHRKELLPMVAASVQFARDADGFMNREGTWLPALVEAIGRCERTEYVRVVEGLLKRRSKATAAVREAAGAAQERLLRRQRRDREAATLLRAATATDETLLRPARSQQAPEEVLLRATEEG